MVRTPDRFPGEADEEGAILEPSDADPTIEGGIRFVSGSFRMKDGSGVFNPRIGGSGFDIDNVVFDVAGGLVYANTGLVVTRA